MITPTRRQKQILGMLQKAHDIKLHPSQREICDSVGSCRDSFEVELTRLQEWGLLRVVSGNVAWAKKKYVIKQCGCDWCESQRNQP